MELQRTPFGLRMPEEVQNWIKMKAKREDRSQNHVINRILAKAMEDDHART
ncbi:Arc family DNA-binding protein [Paracoccus beibuensis]|uniref:Arc family DNA-binding protein n=1 Tax=Paracoccus beibuensis TaxID=547602 RepID=UPI00223F9AE0|nr:Arc family DNA-binding protein [Paracoccus beibuensis]